MSVLEIVADDPRSYELVMPAYGSRLDPPSHASPLGSVRRYRDASAVLHMGPQRWLLVGHATEHEAASVSAVQASGGALVDVSAKWSRLCVTGTGVQGAVSQLLSIKQVLYNRDCAPVSVLGCPTLLARCELGFELWVTRSWSQWLHESLGAIWQSSGLTVRQHVEE